MDIFMAGGLFYGLVAGFLFHWLMQPADVIETKPYYFKWMLFSAACALFWPLFFVALTGLTLWVSVNKD